MTTTRSVPPTQGEKSPGRSRRRLGRALARIAVAVVVIAIVLLLAGGWYFAGKIRSGAFEVDQAKPSMTLRVVAASSDSISLQETGDRQAALRQDDTYGLAWDTGYGQVTGSPQRTGTG